LAAEMIFTGRRVAAEEALRSGLVNAVHAQADLMKNVTELASSIAEASPSAVRASKRLLALTRGVTAASALAEEARVFADQFTGEEQVEGMAAFVEKRKPRFAQSLLKENS
jgi:enoyl-CoA hydratase/carnithine racemase